MANTGIDWMVTVRGADGPPVSYDVGYTWGCGEGRDGVTVSDVTRLDAGTATARLPGLAGTREHWLSSRGTLSAENVAHDAAALLMLRASLAAGRQCPVNTGHSSTSSVARYLEWSGFPAAWTDPLLAFAGIGADALFLDVWTNLAHAAYDYPRETWGVCPRVHEVTMTASQRGSTPSRVLDAGERRAVEAILRRWESEPPAVPGRAHAPRIPAEDLFRAIGVRANAS